MSKINLCNILKTKDYNMFFYIIIFAAIISLGIAFYVQYIMGFEPCILCYYERIPYYLLISMSFLGLWSIRGNKIKMLIIVFILFGAIGLSGYHSAMERGVIDPSAQCDSSVKISKDASIDEITALMYQAPIANCSKAPFRIMYLSMTEWNILWNLLLLLMTLSMMCHKKSK